MPITGHLLDAYAAPGEGVTLWVIPDGGGPRLRLRLPLTAGFFASGDSSRLRRLWQFLQAQPERPDLQREERRELFASSGRTIPVLAARLSSPAALPALFSRAAAAFPDLAYFDADIPVGLRLAAAHGLFPLARLQLEVDGRDWVQSLEALDSPWDLDPPPVPLRILRLAPDCDPRRCEPAYLNVHTNGLSIAEQSTNHSYKFSLHPERALLVNLRAVLEKYDPDLLLTEWGDTWLLPRLMELAEAHGLPLPLSRDPAMPIVQRDERSYHAYGQVIYRGRQVLLAGRWHIDQYNAMMFHDYGLDGILESARVTATPVQQAARLSPGSGISAMQVITALRWGVLIPWHKQQVEDEKTAPELVRADQGGLVYQPLIGLHRDVAEIDFVSMYPGIMAYFNVSPETVGGERLGAERVPELELWVDKDTPGLVPETLRPLLEKRIAFKHRIAELPRWDPRRTVYKARAAAHKWLLVTCFGYLGYKNARFGRIEAHQAVTAYSRECLLRAKEAAEDAGYEALHLYVDGLWIAAPGSVGCEAGAPPGTPAAFRTPADVQSLLEEISRRTRLPIALEGIYRWIAFLPSKQDARIPVPNRYFGVFQDGSLKMRGIEARRGDTPAYIAWVQLRVLDLLAQALDADHLPERMPEIAAFLHGEYRRMRRGGVPLEQLLVSQKLSRELSLYRTPSPAARAAAQLAERGKSTRPGQSIRFVYVRGGKPGVRAWDCPPPPDPQQVDLAIYAKLFRRACLTVLQPFGVTPASLQRCLEERGYRALAAPAWKLPGVKRVEYNLAFSY
jgi:DNA polymerase-2